MLWRQFTGLIGENQQLHKLVKYKKDVRTVIELDQIKALLDEETRKLAELGESL
jgi:hypothetical protein